MLSIVSEVSTTVSSGENDDKKRQQTVSDDENSDEKGQRTINTSHSQNSDKGESSDETKRRCTEVEAEARIIAWVLCQRAKVKREPENSNELNQCDTV